MMRIAECKTLKASVVIGLKRGYTEELFEYEDIKVSIKTVQKDILNVTGLKLSVKISNCEIVFFGQEEPSVSIELIQYPRFIYEESKWIEAVKLFTMKLMNELDQNRTVIIFPDKTLMLENSEMIDPRIDFSP